VDGKEHKGLPAEVSVTLKPGPHKAKFLASSRPPKDVPFTITAGQTLLVPRVEFQAGGLLAVRVLADGRPVEGADITVDGGTFKATEGRVWFPAGTHALETSMPGYEVDRQMITIPDEDLLSVTVKLKRKN
jgi:PEGA domain